jgi:hypothetical protein
MVGLKTSGEEGGEARRVDLVEQVSDGEIISMMIDGSPLNHFLNTQNAQTPGVAKLKEADGGQQHFILELEFVQLLANPTYIHGVFSLLSFAFFFLCNFCVLIAVQIFHALSSKLL